MGEYTCPVLEHAGFLAIIIIARDGFSVLGVYEAIGFKYKVYIGYSMEGALW